MDKTPGQELNQWLKEKSYVIEVRPVMKLMANGLFGTSIEMVVKKEEEKDPGVPLVDQNPPTKELPNFDDPTKKEAK